MTRRKLAALLVPLAAVAAIARGRRLGVRRQPSRS